MNNKKEIERKSSAITLSDMEMFIFPELMYSLVLANIMSPRIWLWLDDPWFAGIERMKPYRRIQRLKQYIMDHYVFNLDLDTWGLTTKEKELDRFKDFINEDTLKQSNALFGYEGDKYYFDIDIRMIRGLPLKGALLVTTRGCPFSCSYCSCTFLRNLTAPQKYLRRKKLKWDKIFANLR